jgi:hypothetical protein
VWELPGLCFACSHVCFSGGAFQYSEMPRSRIDKTRAVFRVFIVPDPSAGGACGRLIARVSTRSPGLLLKA